MPFSVVQKVLGADGNSTTGTSFSITVTALTAGNTVYGACMYASSAIKTPTSIKDNAGTQNTFTLEDGLFDSTNTNGFFTFTKSNITGGGTSITVLFPSSVSFVRIEMEETSGGITGVDAHTMTAQTSTAAPSSATITPAQSGDYLYGASCNSVGGFVVAWSATGGYTIENATTGGPNDGIADEQQTYNSVVAKAATFAANSSSYITGIIAGKPPAAAAACSHHFFQSLGVGCSIGWRAALLGGGAWRAANAIKKNEVITRRRIVLPASSVTFVR